MKKILVASALAVATLSVSPVLSAPAFAQAKGVGVADVRIAAARSNAFQAASTQIETTYKAQIDQQQSRGQTLQAEINVLIAKYNEEAKKTPQNQTTLQAAPRRYRTSVRQRRPNSAASARSSTSPSPMSRIRSAFA